MADLAESVLQYLDKNEKADTIDLAITLNEDHQKVVGAVKSLQAFGDVGGSEFANFHWPYRMFAIWEDFRPVASSQHTKH